MVEMQAKKRILTGDRPTGSLHLGHYFGTLQNRVKLQNEGYETYIIIADYQVLTDRLETEEIKENIYNLIYGYMSVGLDPEKSTFFVQSHVPQLAELTQVLSMLVSMNRVGRNPTVKEEIKTMGLESNVSLGMFSYPVSQAADILLFQANFVPVGEDQLPHIELTKEIARRFNSLYGNVFTIPDAMLSDFPRLVGLDGSQKMSKSRGNAIFLNDSPEEVKAKVMRAKTDSGSTIKYDKKNKPYLTALIDLYSLVSGLNRFDIEEKFPDVGYKVFKESLADEINKFLDPIREKRASIKQSYVEEVANEGTKRAREYGEKTMQAVREAMKMDYGLK